MATLNLSSFKPSSGQLVSASPISNAFTAIEAAVNSIDNTQFASGRIFDPTKLIEASSVQRIADSTAGGTVANIDFTSISANFAHLLAVICGRGDNAATQSTLMRFNNDSGNNYGAQRVSGNAASASAAEVVSTSAITVGQVPGTGATANFFSAMAVFIPQYAGTTGNKSSVALWTISTAITTGTMSAGVFSGVWSTTATAINRITFLPAAGNFIAGSRATLYGLG